MSRKVLLMSVFAVILFSASLFVSDYTRAGDKEQGFLGVHIQGISTTLKTQLGLDDGVVVSKVLEGSPAEKAGILKDDIITELNGTTMKKPGTLSRLVGKFEPGKKVNLTIFRSGKKKTVNVELGKKVHKKAHMHKDFMKKYHKFQPNAQMGVKISDLNDDLSGYFGVKSGDGVLILKVNEESAASKAGLKAGDIIVKVNNEAVSSTNLVREIISEFDAGEEVTVDIVRKNSAKSVKVLLEEADSPEHDFHIQKMILPDMEDIEIEIEGEMHDKLMDMDENCKKKEIRIIKKIGNSKDSI